MEARPVDLNVRDHTNGDAFAHTRAPREKAPPARASQLLRVVQIGERPDAMVAKGARSRAARRQRQAGLRAIRDRPRPRPLQRAPRRRSNLRSLCPVLFRVRRLIGGRLSAAGRLRLRRRLVVVDLDSASARALLRLGLAAALFVVCDGLASSRSSSPTASGAPSEDTLPPYCLARTRAFFPTFSRK